MKAASLALLGCLVTLAAETRGEIRTINLDFGNGGVYSGDDGVLSSPGGTYWNEVTVGDANISSFGFAEAFKLRDEFGVTFGLPFLLPSVNAFATEVVSVTGSGEGPLSDGVTILGEDFNLSGLVIRELSDESPIEVVVYFVNPLTPDARPNTVRVTGNDYPQSEPITSAGGFGDFPGFGNILPDFPRVGPYDYARFDGLSPIGTTIGYPLLPGIVVGSPPGAVAHIAAIQVRGEFVFTPEPSAGVMALLAFAAVATRRRVTSAR